MGAWSDNVMMIVSDNGSKMEDAIDKKLDFKSIKLE